jgi:hypothetical protein
MFREFEDGLTNTITGAGESALGSLALQKSSRAA